MNYRDYLSAANVIGWFTLLPTVICYGVALLYWMIDHNERARNNWFVTGSAIPLIGLLILITTATAGLVTLPR